KEEMISFFNQYIHPSSPDRAKLVVHLYAQGSAESKARMDELIKDLAVESAETKEAVRSALMRAELRSDPDALRAYLTGELKLTPDEVEAVLKAAKDPATEPKETAEGADVPVANGNGNGN